MPDQRSRTISLSIETAGKGKDTGFYILGICLNAAAGLLLGVTFAVYDFKNFVDQDTETRTLYLASASEIIMDIAFIVTGIVLLRSINRISQSLQKTHDKQEINIGMVRLHALAFGLFLVGRIIFSAANIAYLIKQSPFVL